MCEYLDSESLVVDEADETIESAHYGDQIILSRMTVLSHYFNNDWDLKEFFRVTEFDSRAIIRVKNMFLRLDETYRLERLSPTQYLFI